LYPRISEYPRGDGPFVRVTKKLLKKIKEKEKTPLDKAPHWTTRLDKCDVILLQSLLKVNDTALSSIGCA